MRKKEKDFIPIAFMLYPENGSIDFNGLRLLLKNLMIQFKCIHRGLGMLFLLLNLCLSSFGQNNSFVLTTDALKEHVAYFNSIDSEAVVNFIPNSQSFNWLAENIPLFDCPDSAIAQTYYYRWWSFRKHLKETPDGFIFTEFIEPVKHEGKYGAISCALGHHIYEGRWLRNQAYIKQYIDFWLIKEPTFKPSKFHSFSSWLSDAVYNLYLVQQNKEQLAKWLPLLDKDYKRWEQERQLPSGLFWQFDVKDGMEESVSGGRRIQNRRPSINSYMYGNAQALSEMAKLFRIDSLVDKYNRKADILKKLVVDSLWDRERKFFSTRHPDGQLAAREAIGFIPWYFNLPPDENEYAEAWLQLTDTAGFDAPWGITTAERREPTFRTRGTGHSCEWDGAVWPFATTQTLKALSNWLTAYKRHQKVDATVFFEKLRQYAVSHQKDEKPYIGEYQDEKTGYWLKGDNPRSTFYNHSGFCDLVISDLIGLKPANGSRITVKPLVPAGEWDWFCLDNLSYQGRTLTILWDRTGERYGRGKGFLLFVNGKRVASSKNLGELNAKIN
ncbi:glycosyl hydrolase family 65 protein [Olivibacter sp. XZL3]|uniref:MGH1-like glycoside hydrolase domain-containing protein n=1 Tax=Olivibacter sp. XZL3 TaxID=1735116 RepID=UPI001F0E175A|nr:glycosyl hydrolase family 65 protein [Olivibacter sp. XZL3]